MRATWEPRCVCTYRLRARAGIRGPLFVREVSKRWQYAGTVSALLPSMYAILLSLLVATSGAATPREVYVAVEGNCDGYPRLAIGMAPGFCAGLVWGPAAGAFGSRAMKTPRMLLPQKDGEGWIVSDLGRWTAGQGAIWRLVPVRGGSARVTKLIGGLAMPAHPRVRPDGKVYGEMATSSASIPMPRI